MSSSLVPKGSPDIEVVWRDPSTHRSKPQVRKYIEKAVKSFARSLGLDRKGAKTVQINSPMHIGRDRTDPNHVTVNYLMEDGTAITHDFQGRLTKGYHVYVDAAEAEKNDQPSSSNTKENTSRARTGSIATFPLNEGLFSVFS
ncbi:hypothetical protein FRC02_011493 [Tulasnella sp. 418]|nr:hypothetical protein FRC02_011493 [Tulasnella sp. 418]